MARISSPVLFSKHFGIDSKTLADAGLIDPFINVDVPLFIDPILLEKCSLELIRTQGLDAFRGHFETFIRLLTMSEAKGDAAWKAARRQLDLREPAENGLGYGRSGRQGSSRPERIRTAIMRTSKEIIKLGVKDPEMISLMGFFEDEVGPDTISDFTTHAIHEQLASLTHSFCEKHGVPIESTSLSGKYQLPILRRGNNKHQPLVLIPIDIVRDLPVANDRSEIEAAASENQKIRDQVNQYLSGIAKPTISDRKSAIRNAVLSSAKNFEQFLAGVKAHADNYDPNADALGYYAFKKIISEGLEGLKLDKTYNLAKGPEEVLRVVQDSIEVFKRHVEAGNLWEELWINGKPKRERASQLIYSAIADAFCQANGVDISPEANMGGGPVDFKFSSSYQSRVLVEMKRSLGTVVHGYEKQLEFYKTASQTDYGIFVVMDYGDLGEKFNEISRIRQRRLAAGQRASEIVVIDATPKASASKRR